jgi:8-oxo-dGTP diphosphatase
MINVVCAVIRDADGRLLVCQRPEGKALQGKWEFPGGKVEPGEVPELALRREVAEELACEVRVGRALAAVEHHYPECSIRLLPFLCTLRSGEPSAVEHSEVRWVTLSQCTTLDWAEADVPVWQALKAR